MEWTNSTRRGEARRDERRRGGGVVGYTQARVIMTREGWIINFTRFLKINSNFSSGDPTMFPYWSVNN